ncbi:MAG: hypothetical protein ACREM3_00055 [Candidatus Rokuibacteriota bacterium]
MTRPRQGGTVEEMRTPVRAAPPAVERWASRARWLRSLDALMAWLAIWPFMALLLEDASAGATAVVAGLLVAVAAFVRALRLRWRPVSGLVSLSVSRELRPGDRAWLVLPERVEPVIVTARRGIRLVVARPDQGPAEGLEVRRTRVLVVPPAR